MSGSTWALALHGGAGTISKASMTPEKEVAYRAGLMAALAAGRAVLAAGGAAEEAVVATVIELENDPLFNAGRGSVLTSAGRVEMDAALMRGRDLAAGAVAGITRVRNPILLARAVMEQSPQVMLCGEGAEAFAAAAGLAFAEPDYFITDMRLEQLRAARAADVVSLDHNDHKYGTVGAVARDRAGNLAAATSTGGMTNKRPGRIGDSPVIGAGTYANGVAAVSATGHGETFIRMTVARDIAALIDYAGLDLDAAVRRKVIDELPRIGGSGGVIAVGAHGAPVLAFNTPGMYRAAEEEGGTSTVAFYS